MSPKSRQPIEDEPADLPPEIPDGYVRVTPPRRPETKKRKASVWWGVGGFVVAVAAVIAVIVVASLPGDPQAAPDTTAKAVAEALTAHDLAKVDSYLCAQAPRMPELTTFFGSFGHASVLAVQPQHGEFADATLRSTDRPGVDLVLQMAKDDGSWCVFGPVPCNTLSTVPATAEFADVCNDRPRP